MMICPECNGKGETIYYVETDRDENTVTVEQRKGICRTCNGSGEKPKTNADRIRAMSDEEKAREFVFFCPSDAVFRGEDTYGKPHYTGLDGKYYSTSDEVIHANMKWLKQPAQEEL